MSSNSFDPTSASLIHRAQADDQDAWGQLVELYGPLVAHWCRRSGLSDEDTADVFQDTFRAVAANLAGFAPQRAEGSFRRWLRTIVRTKVVDHFRKAARQSSGRGGTTAFVQMSNVADPLAEADDDAENDASEHALLVQRALELIEKEFQPQNWTAFQQVTIDGRSAVDVAEQMGVSPQVVRQANYRIRRRLRLMLEGSFGSADE